MKAVTEERKAKVLEIMTRHVGREKAIGMGELYEMVFRKPWQNRIADTRDLRFVITDLRHRGVLIADTRGRTGGGYYLARSEHEIRQFLDRRTHEALKKLKMVAAMRGKTLPEFMGQLQLSLQSGQEESGQQSAVSDQ